MHFCCLTGWSAAGFYLSAELAGCVPGTARILKGGLSIAINIKLNKSQTQPDGGEGYSGKATGCR